MENSTMDEAENSQEDTFVILVATDNHLGYMEKDPVRGNDSMKTFEEILKLAKDNKVDFLLLGGDLFHDNKPSKKCIHDCMVLLRKYCMGDRPIAVEFLSDQSENFKANSFPMVNYEDPNMNVSIPVFSIHGNHDDPTGAGNLCSLDMLGVAGLVNYFGKCTDLNAVQISPLLMQKGVSKLAIYGLGSIRDERLHRMFREGKVSTLRPREDEDDWFSIFVIHQNRAIRGPKNFIPGHFIDEFIDLVIWGHEHDCRIEPEKEEYASFKHGGFYISQPGSSIATSLCPGETLPKHVGLLQINKKHFKMTKLPLKTVRPLYLENTSIFESGLEVDDPKLVIKFTNFLRDKVDAMLEKADLDRIGNDAIPEKPLIRLRVEIRNRSVEAINVFRFGQFYMDKVANPKDILLFFVKPVFRPKGGNDTKFDEDQMDQLMLGVSMDTTRVEDIVKQYFESNSSEEDLKLDLLSENGMGVAIKEYVDKQVRDAIDDMVKHQLKKAYAHLNSKDMDDGAIDHEIHEYRVQRMKNVKTETQDAQQAMAMSRSKENGNYEHVLSSDAEEEELIPTVKAPRGGRGSRARGRARGQGGARGGRNKSVVDSPPDSPPPKRGRGRASAKSATGGSSGGRSTRGTKQVTLKSSFENQSKRNGNEDVTVIDDDSDEEFNSRASTSKRSRSSSRLTVKGRKKTFDFEDSD